MSKHTYGFSSERDREECKHLAVEMAKEAGFISEDAEFTLEVVETDAHKANNEFVVVIRTSEQ